MIRGGPRTTHEGKYSPLWASSLGHPTLVEGSPLVYSMWLFSTKILFVLVINLKLRKGYKKIIEICWNYSHIYQDQANSLALSVWMEN